MNRRDFLKSSMAGAAGLAIASSPVAALTSCSSDKGGCCGKNTELKLSFQEKTAPGESLNERFDYMEKLGIVGFEPGGRNLAGTANRPETGRDPGGQGHQGRAGPADPGLEGRARHHPRPGHRPGGR